MSATQAWFVLAQLCNLAVSAYALHVGIMILRSTDEH